MVIFIVVVVLLLLLYKRRYSLVWLPAEAQQQRTTTGPQFPEATLDEMRVCRLEGLEIARNGAKLLGCPIGTDAFKQSFFHAKLEEIQGLLHKIGLLHNSQIQILLLRFCAHPRVIYIGIV